MLRSLTCAAVFVVLIGQGTTAETLHLRCAIESMTDGLKDNAVIETEFAPRFFSIDLLERGYWTFYKSGDFDFENRTNSVVRFNESEIVLQDEKVELGELSVVAFEQLNRLDGSYTLYVSNWEGSEPTISRTQHGKCSTISPAQFPQKTDRKF